MFNTYKFKEIFGISATEVWAMDVNEFTQWSFGDYKEKKMEEIWHDLRKDPTDLPKDTNTVWVILSETPTEVDMDSYNPENKGNIMTVPAYDTETDDGNIEHHESRQYEASGWWAYDEPGWITHWMYMNVPEPPQE